MTQIRFLVLFMALCLQALWSPLHLQADEAVGFVKIAEKKSSVMRKGRMIEIKPGDSLYGNDILQTDKTGAIKFTLLDETMLSLGPDTEFILSEYVYKPKKKEYSFVSKVTRGTLHFISGNLAKVAPESVKVKTPSGTVGIRGTSFMIKVDKED